MGGPVCVYHNFERGSSKVHSTKFGYKWCNSLRGVDYRWFSSLRGFDQNLKVYEDDNQCDDNTLHWPFGAELKTEFILDEI